MEKKLLTWGIAIINMAGKQDPNEDYNFSSITLECEGRECGLDVTKSTSDYREKGDYTNYQMYLDKDEEIFDECLYDLTLEDMSNPNLKVSFWIDGTFENEIQLIQFATKIDGKLEWVDVQQN